jgi:hypothetical protein
LGSETFRKDSREIVKVSVTDLFFRGLPDRGRLDQPPKNKLDLNRLRARMGEKPRTKVGQIRQAWPDIKALFDAGHSLKDIWMWLNEIGIEIGYARLSHYIGQIKRKDQTAAPGVTFPLIAEVPPIDPSPVSTHDGPARESKTEPQRSPMPDDPLANIREREDRRSGFQYNSEPDIKKLI